MFVAVLAHSDMTCVEAVPDQSVCHWTMAHRRAIGEPTIADAVLGDS